MNNLLKIIAVLLISYPIYSTAQDCTINSGTLIEVCESDVTFNLNGDLPEGASDWSWSSAELDIWDLTDPSSVVDVPAPGSYDLEATVVCPNGMLASQFVTVEVLAPLDLPEIELEYNTCVPFLIGHNSAEFITLPTVSDYLPSGFNGAWSLGEELSDYINLADNNQIIEIGAALSDYMFENGLSEINLDIELSGQGGDHPCQVFESTSAIFTPYFHPSDKNHERCINENSYTYSANMPFAHLGNIELLLTGEDASLVTLEYDNENNPDNFSLTVDLSGLECGEEIQFDLAISNETDCADTEVGTVSFILIKEVQVSLQFDGSNIMYCQSNTLTSFDFDGDGVSSDAYYYEIEAPQVVSEGSGGCEYNPELYPLSIWDISVNCYNSPSPSVDINHNDPNLVHYQIDEELNICYLWISQEVAILEEEYNYLNIYYNTNTACSAIQALFLLANEIAPKDYTIDLYCTDQLYQFDFPCYFNLLDISSSPSGSDLANGWYEAPEDANFDLQIPNLLNPINFNSPGEYSFYFWTNNNTGSSCPYIITYTINVPAENLEVNAGTDFTTCLGGGDDVVVGTTNFSDLVGDWSIVSYPISPPEAYQSQDPETPNHAYFTATDIGEYTFEFTVGDENCSVTDQVTVTVEDCNTCYAALESCAGLSGIGGSSSSIACYPCYTPISYSLVDELGNVLSPLDGWVFDWSNGSTSNPTIISGSEIVTVTAFNTNNSCSQEFTINSDCCQNKPIENIGCRYFKNASWLTWDEVEGVTEYQVEMNFSDINCECNWLIQATGSLLFEVNSNYFKLDPAWKNCFSYRIRARCNNSWGEWSDLNCPSKFCIPFKEFNNNNLISIRSEENDLSTDYKFISIFNLLGQEVKKYSVESELNFEISKDLSPGAYIMVTWDANNKQESIKRFFVD